jgi:hypothetical protein
MWANQQRHAFYAEQAARTEAPDGSHLADKSTGYMLMWYALLYAVVETVSERGVELRGQFGADIAALEDPLRLCRNATLHVSRSGYWDQRILDFFALPESVPLVRAISTGFGRLLLEEVGRRAPS